MGGIIVFQLKLDTECLYCDLSCEIRVKVMRVSKCGS